MIYRESTANRTIVGHIEEGDEIVEQLVAFCEQEDIEGAFVRAVGHVRAVELAHFRSDKGDYEPVLEGRGDFELVQLNGTIAKLGDKLVPNLEAMVSNGSAIGTSSSAGQLRKGVSAGCDFVLTAFDDLTLERQLDPETGRVPLSAIERSESDAETHARAKKESPVHESDSKKTPADKGMSWEQAAEASQAGSTSSERKPEAAKQTEADDGVFGDLDTQQAHISAGDRLEHPKLGICQVIKVEEDKYLHIRLPSGKIRKLSLSIVDVEFKESENGKNVFEAHLNP